MKYSTVLFYSFTIWCLLSCSNKKEQGKDAFSTTEKLEYTVQYARGFSVNIYDNLKEVTVRNPWDTTKILQKYILVDKKEKLPESLPDGILIRTPLSKVVAYSTIHCATLNEIDVINSVTGVCEYQYINIPYITDGVKNGTVADLGEAAKPNVEKIIDLSPDAIFATPIQGLNYGGIEKSGIPVIETPDYMEQTALGRAEWIRFYSLFYNNEAHVDSLFNITVGNYNEIKAKAASAQNRPSVFLDLMNKGTWYIAGGNSFISKMLEDAGATYVWHDDNRDQSIPLPFEEILDKAGEADFWLIKHFSPGPLTYSSLQKEYKPYSYFGAFKDKNIYECNTKERDYYEDLPIHPDYILQDFAYVFHPELFPDYTPKYYTKMKE